MLPTLDWITRGVRCLPRAGIQHTSLVVLCRCSTRAELMAIRRKRGLPTCPRAWSHPSDLLPVGSVAGAPAAVPNHFAVLELRHITHSRMPGPNKALLRRGALLTQELGILCAPAVFR